jgi:hypothetical protein
MLFTPEMARMEQDSSMQLVNLIQFNATFNVWKRQPKAVFV